MTVTPDLFGPLVDLPLIEEKVLAHVRKWFPEYLRNAERKGAVTWPNGDPLVPGSLPLPASYEPTTGEPEKWPESQLPALIFGSPGLAGAPHRDGDGDYEVDWLCALSAVTSGNDAASTRFLCGKYVAALRLMFAQQRLVDDLPVVGGSWDDEAYNLFSLTQTRALMVGTTTFTLSLAQVANDYAGPREPREDPIPDPGQNPTITTTELDVERSPVG